jgi:hypothetical protein
VSLDAEYKIGRSWAGEPLDGARETTTQGLTAAREAATRELDGEDSSVAAAGDDGDDGNIDESDSHQGDDEADDIEGSEIDGPGQQAAAVECGVAEPAAPDFGPLETCCERHSGSDGVATDERPFWAMPVIMEVPSGSPEFEAILASLSAEERAIARPLRANGGDAEPGAATAEPEGEAERRRFGQR